MINFEDTPIWNEVQDLLAEKKHRQLYDYTGIAHTEKEDFAVWDMYWMENLRDFLHELAETATIRFRIGLGDYVKRLYPYRANLEFTVRQVPLKGNGTTPDASQPTTVVRYKALFNPQQNPPVAAGEMENHKYDDLNKSDVVEVQLQLVDRAAEPLRIKQTGGVFQKVKPEQVVRNVLGGESLKVLVDGKPSIDGLDLVTPDNLEVIPNLIIPDGTNITSIPTMLQEKVGGLYNGGIGTFLHKFDGKKMWFVFPPYDYTRFDKKGPKAIFYGIPQEKLPQIDNTYRMDGKVLKVLLTANRRYVDSGEINQMNQGSGYRFADARAFMKKPVKITATGIEASRVHLNHEVAMSSRADGLNYAPMDKTGPSSNPYTYRAAAIARTLGQLDAVWENSDKNLIYPGMPCQYVFMSGDKVITLRGCVLFVHAFATRVEKYNASAFREVCRITIACEPQSNVPDVPTQGNASDSFDGWIDDMKGLG